MGGGRGWERGRRKRVERDSGFPSPWTIEASYVCCVNGSKSIEIS